MIKTSKLFAEKKFPDWFSEHSIFKKITEIKKVFPKIGLPNTEKEVIFDDGGPAFESAKAVMIAIRSQLLRRSKALASFIEKKPEMGAKRKANGIKIISLLGTLSEIINAHEAKLIKENNGRLTINIPNDICLDGEARPVFRNGESLFRVYNKLSAALVENKFAKICRLEDLYEFKSFSADNIPNNKLKVVFSSDGVDGAWDIATMSMRGIKSCQSWDGEYRHCTIGSVIDPFVGIIYLTSGGKFNNCGSKMIRRCIVRFAVDNSKGKPVIMLDNMYPSCDKKILLEFKNTIKELSKNKFEVQYAPMESKLNNTYMPLTDIRKLLKETDSAGSGNYPEEDLESIQSYHDYKIQDKKSNKNDEQAALLESNLKKMDRNFAAVFEKAVFDSIKLTDTAEFSDSFKPIIRRLKGEDKKFFDYTCTIKNLSKTMSNLIHKSLDKKNFVDSKSYYRRMFCYYLNNKNKILDTSKQKMIRELNIRAQKSAKLAPEDFITAMKTLLPKIDFYVKESLKKYLLQEQSQKVLPLP